MNLKTFLLAALAAFTLASCDKDENNNVKPKSETPLRMWVCLSKKVLMVVGHM